MYSYIKSNKIDIFNLKLLDKRDEYLFQEKNSRYVEYQELLKFSHREKLVLLNKKLFQRLPPRQFGDSINVYEIITPEFEARDLFDLCCCLGWKLEWSWIYPLWDFSTSREDKEFIGLKAITPTNQEVLFCFNCSFSMPQHYVNQFRERRNPKSLCDRCTHHHGKTYNGVFFNCGFSPYGIKGNYCADFEVKDSVGILQKTVFHSYSAKRKEIPFREEIQGYDYVVLIVSGAINQYIIKFLNLMFAIIICIAAISSLFPELALNDNFYFVLRTVCLILIYDSFLRSINHFVKHHNTSVLRVYWIKIALLMSSSILLS